MKYLVRLNALTNTAEVIPVQPGTNLLKVAYTLMECNSIQLLPLFNRRLPSGYEAVCDENTFGKMLVFNPLASWLYGCDEHGKPIVNNVIIFRIEEDDFSLMSEDEARKIADDLNDQADEIYSLTLHKAMGNK